MPLLTYDNGPDFGDPVKELRNSSIPDYIECGENNDWWLYVQRSTRTIELHPKVPGMAIKYCKLDSEFPKRFHPERYGMTPQQVSAVETALKLGRNPA